MNKQNVAAYPYNGRLFDHKKEWSTDTHNMKKPITKDNI